MAVGIAKMNCRKIAGENGSFLVRPSSQPQNPLTLVLWYNRRLYNISIRYRADGRYALGSEKANELVCCLQLVLKQSRPIT